MAGSGAALRRLTRALYQMARAANRLRIAESALRGHLRPWVTHALNKQLFRLFGRFLIK